MIYKNRDIEAVINERGVNLGNIDVVFYTKDINTTSFRLFLKQKIEYANETFYDIFDLRNKGLTPYIDLTMEDGSIFTREPMEIVEADAGLIQYNIPSDILLHVGKVEASVYLLSDTNKEDEGVEVAQFYFYIDDDGLTSRVRRVVNTHIVDEAVARVLSQDAQKLLDSRYKTNLENSLRSYLFENADRFKGPKGDEGDVGERGPKGDKGDTGPQGEKGPIGPEGPKGDVGEKGDTGERGPQGDMGPQGPKGDIGDRGQNLKYNDLTDQEKEELKSVISSQAISDFTLGNNSIGTNKIDFIKSGKNIYNKNNPTPGRISVNGKLFEDDTVITSSYTKIKSNTTYVSNQSIWYDLYDNELKYIEYKFVPKGGTFTTTASTAFIRIAVKKDVSDTLQVEEGTNQTTYEPFYYVAENVKDLEIVEARYSTPKNKGYNKLNDRLQDIEKNLSDITVSNGGNIASDENAEKVFVDEMNKKVKQLGGNSKFLNSSGLTAAGQLAYAYDFNVITLHASTKNEIASVWGQDTYSLDIKGENPRTVEVNSTVTSPSLENYYSLIGGKTGTLGYIHNLTAIVADNDDLYIGTIMKGSEDRFADLKIAIDETIKKENGKPYNVDLVGTSDTMFSVIKYPKYNPTLTTNNKPISILSKNGNVRTSPASMTKLLTCIVLIENISNLNQTITFQESDFVGGSGVELKVGDVITLRDALYTMLLSSSNDTAKAVARVVGHHIINTRRYI